MFLARRPIGQSSLRPVPHILGGVEFRGISGDVLRMDTRVTRQEVLHQLPAMNRAAIPEEDDGPPQMAEQVLEELHDFFSPEGAAPELKIESHSRMLGRYRDRIEGVDAALFIPHRAVRGVALGRPGAFEVGDEQKPTFIQENQVRPKPTGLLL